jgi:hypothetical protein
MFHVSNPQSLRTLKSIRERKTISRSIHGQIDGPEVPFKLAEGHFLARRLIFWKSDFQKIGARAGKWPAILNYMQKHLILQALRTQLTSWALKLVGLLRLGQGVTAAQALRLVSSCHQRGDVQAL